jgi:hypothetical protein
MSDSQGFRDLNTYIEFLLARVLSLLSGDVLPTVGHPQVRFANCDLRIRYQIDPF